ncbi:polysaccharide biosynthesis protein, partial [Halobacillus sp. BAB-2008]|uniref:lipopolysaccharide biosynthesis protein n=1 Tax=Halobacillus sp. BAB-2008 TaxID=1246484 RepID=UPI0002A50C27
MIPYSAASIFFMIYTQGNIFITNTVLGDESSGIYFVAFSVMNVIYLFPVTFYQSYLIPKVHRWINRDKGKVDIIYEFGSSLAVLIGIIALTPLVALSMYIIPLLFGEDYIYSSLIVIILSITIPF